MSSVDSGGHRVETASTGGGASFSSISLGLQGLLCVDVSVAVQDPEKLQFDFQCQVAPLG